MSGHGEQDYREARWAGPTHGSARDADGDMTVASASPPPPPGLVEEARGAAGRAALAAGVEIAELHGVGQLGAMVELFDEIWGTGQESLLPLGVARALEHAGNYVAGAFDRAGGELVGAIIGFLGRRDGRLILHSHIAGVHHRSQGRTVGFALKQHQRAWALAAGIETVEWTFDPLVRRNTFFNVTKLGVRVVAYHADFYGPMDDAVNAGEPSDRCVARWELTSPAAVAAAAGVATEPDTAALLAAGTRVLLDEGPDGVPVRHPLGGGGGARLAWAPADVVALRARRPELARAWRLALREAVGGALDAGYALTGATRAGWYVLTRKKPE